MTDVKALIAEIRQNAACETVSLKSVLQLADICEQLLQQKDRAHEALRSLEWRDPLTMKSGYSDLIVLHRLGAFMDRMDAEQAVIQYGLGKRNPDPSVTNHD